MAWESVVIIDPRSTEEELKAGLLVDFLKSWLFAPVNKLSIDLLRLNLENGAGHEHRVGPIAERAAALFAEKAALSLKLQGSRSTVLESLANETINLDLNTTSNEQAAGAIADAWLQALTLRLKINS